MDRDEILAKSRAEKRDEGQTYADAVGRRAGLIAMTAMMLILLMFNSRMGRRSDDVFCMYWTYLGVKAFGKYRVTGNRGRLTGAAVGLLLGVAFLVLHVLRTCGVL